jgi:hypothetical protein
MAEIPAAGGPGRRSLEAALLVVPITALAFNLRAAITSPGTRKPTARPPITTQSY